ncbi:hypothetical protein, partial [Vibrio parahaemolyticus]|uniref:hypothetical protein n=1 Tax=Vibrio parahaemolyticus TaxID=670 RepID=UPI001E4EA619
ASVLRCSHLNRALCDPTFQNRVLFMVSLKYNAHFNVNFRGITMDYAQDPMTGFKTLELAFSQGFRMRRVPFTQDVYYVKDKALDSDRYTYARLDGLKVQQTVVLNGNEPLNDLPCFCLFYGTLESLRGTGVTVPFITQILEQFKKDLPKKMKEYYVETIVDIDNAASLAVAEKLFGQYSHDGIDERTGETTRIWQTKFSK